MIPAAHITQWAKHTPWPTREQVEQDLVLSRLIAETSLELVATKLRALHQRRKGHDLFDLWLALTEVRLDPDEIVAWFAPYLPDGYDRAAADATLAEHVSHAGFRVDVAALTELPGDYDIDAAAALIRAELLASL